MGLWHRMTRPIRDIRRTEDDFMPASVFGGAVGGIGGIVPLAMLDVTFFGGAGTIFYALPALAGGGAWGVAKIEEKFGNKTKGSIHRHDIIGDADKVYRIVQSEKIIKEITEKFNHKAELPPRAQRKVNAYLADMAEALKDCRVVYGVSQVPTLPVTRELLDAQGLKTRQPIASLPAQKPRLQDIRRGL